MNFPLSGQTADIWREAQLVQQQGNLERAIQLYDSVISRQADFAEAYYKRANAKNGLGRVEAAIADYDRTIKLDPKHSNAFCNRGSALERLHRSDEALNSYDRAISINAGDALAYYNRGSVLKTLGRLNDALASYDKAIAHKPNYVEAYINRGNVLQDLQRHEDAITSYSRAIEISPAFAAAFQGRGSSFESLKRFEAAVADYTQALALEENRDFLLGLRLHAQMSICDWRNFATDLEKLSIGLSARRAVATPFTTLALVDAPRLHRAAAEIWVKEKCAPNNLLGPILPRSRHDRIRVAYFSPDFREHPVSHLTAELFERHDRSKFEITAYAFGPAAQDATRHRLERAFDHFIDVTGRSDVEAATHARAAEIDIAVDLAGFTTHCRPTIFALRAAPIQLSYIGYLGTMGAPYMDYLLADQAIIPAAQRQHYSENIIYLPTYQANDSRRPRPPWTYTRAELGLPSSGFVYSCFNANYKIVPDLFQSWMRILLRVPHSTLFLYASDPIAEANLGEQAERCGVDSARVVFGARLPYEGYLARFAAMDLFLDTLPYNAGTTASDALWAGLPVLTRVGEGFAGRVAASLLLALELPELITSSVAEYEDLAVELATNAKRLALIREKLGQNRLTAPLFNTSMFTKHLESAYTEIHDRHHTGRLPTDLTVPLIASLTTPVAR